MGSGGVVTGGSRASRLGRVFWGGPSGFIFSPKLANSSLPSGVLGGCATRRSLTDEVQCSSNTVLSLGETVHTITSAGL